MKDSVKCGVLFKHDQIFVDTPSEDDLLDLEYDFIVYLSKIEEYNGNGKYRLKYFNRSNQLTDIIRKSWCAAPVIEMPFHWKGCYLKISFKDPKGEAKIIKSELVKRTGDFYSKVVSFLFEKLEELSQFENWFQYDLAEENRELKKENEVLKNEILDLKKRLDKIME